MGTWSARAEDVVAAVQRACLDDLDPATLHERVVAQLRRVVPFEGYCAHDADPASGLPIRLYLDPPDERRVRFFLEQVYFEEDFNDFLWLIRSHRWVARLSDATSGHLDRSFRYRAAIGPNGLHFDLRCAYGVRGEHWGGITLLRERGSRDFSDDEVGVLRRLAHQLGAGLRSATLRALGAAELAGTKASGVIVLDAFGRVVQHTPAAERLLRELVDLGPDWREGWGLPDAVWLAIGALRRTLHPQTERDRTSVPCARARARSGQWIEIQAAQAEGRDGRVGDVVLVLAPVEPSALAWLRTAAYDLTPREEQIVESVVRGASTRQIADELCITEYTVQDHLKHIFDKVGVRGRRALLKKLYLDGQRWPPIGGVCAVPSCDPADTP